MKALFLCLALMGLLLAGCVGAVTPDVESTVQVAIAATLTAQPTETATETPTRTPTRDVDSTVQVAVAATLTAQPTKTSMPTPTETPTCTPTPKATPTLALPPTKTPPPFTLSLKTHQGQGFSFQYPANARLEKVTPTRKAWQVSSPAIDQIHVIGPQVWVKPGDADWSYSGSAYYVTIRTYENPKGLDAESWARDYILTSWREARERNRPWGALPVSEEGEIDEDKVGSSAIAGQPAFWVSYMAFDSFDRAYYLSINHQIVELSFRLYPLANQPLAMVQRDVYALILGTFHPEET
jgi:hypothetical protein